MHRPHTSTATLPNLEGLAEVYKALLEHGFTDERVQQAFQVTGAPTAF